MQKKYAEEMSMDRLDTLLTSIAAYMDNIGLVVSSSHGSIRTCSKANVQFMSSHNVNFVDNGRKLILTLETFTRPTFDSPSYKEVEKEIWDTDHPQQFSKVDEFVIYEYDDDAAQWLIYHSFANWTDAFKFAMTVFNYAILSADATG